MSGYTSRSRGPRSTGVPAKLRRRVMARDQATCQVAGPGCTTVARDVDHIIPVFEGGTDALANLRAICPACHAAKTQAEAQRARARGSRRRPPPRHPAMGADLATADGCVTPTQRAAATWAGVGIPAPPPRQPRTA